MKMGWLPFTFTKHLGFKKRLMYGKRSAETDEDRASRLSSVSQFHVREVVLNNADRQAVLLKVRAKEPGFPTERYEQALDEAENWVRADLERSRQRRAELVRAARKEDVLNAVFVLRYFNHRYSGRVTEYDLGQVNIYESLRDLYDQADIDAAVVRVDALIRDAARSVEYDPEAGKARWQELMHSHPGFNNRSLHKAMEWGYFSNR